MPLLVRKEEYSTIINVVVVRIKDDFIDLPVVFVINMRWAAPTSIIHGTRDAFSTGSHAQNPPKLNAS